MISIIVCSIKPELLVALELNIKSTIGVAYEIIAYDNTEHGYGICKVYNKCAQRAKYPNLCFVHEDVLFTSLDWGVVISEFLDNKNVGVIGFAGAKVKLDTLSAWGASYYLERFCFSSDGKYYYNNPDHEDFSEVVCLDGFCLFVRTEVWQKHKFDEDLFDKFHSYDLDFSLNIAQYYKNYTCYKIGITHLSPGSFSSSWLIENEKFLAKWSTVLPFCIVSLTNAELKRIKCILSYHILKKGLREAVISRELLKKYLYVFLVNVNNFPYSVKLLPKYFFYLLKGKS